jgi:hypothetical protein
VLVSARPFTYLFVTYVTTIRGYINLELCEVYCVVLHVAVEFIFVVFVEVSMGVS